MAASKKFVDELNEYLDKLTRMYLGKLDGFLNALYNHRFRIKYNISELFR
jgi:hypothetical protein